MPKKKEYAIARCPRCRGTVYLRPRRVRKRVKTSCDGCDNIFYVIVEGTTVTPDE